MRGMLKVWRLRFQKYCSPRNISNWLTASGTNELSWIQLYDPPPNLFIYYTFTTFDCMLSLLCVWMGDTGEVYFILFSTPESKIFSIIQKRAYLLKAEIYYVYNNPSKKHFRATFKEGAYILIWIVTLLKWVVDCFFSRLDCVYGVQSSMCSCLVFLKTHYFSHNLPLFHTSLSLLWQTPRFISWFYEAPPSEIHNGLRLVSWLSVLWLAKPPLLHVWTSRPSPQWHVLRLNCKQWRCL